MQSRGENRIRSEFMIAVDNVKEANLREFVKEAFLHASKEVSNLLNLSWLFCEKISENERDLLCFCALACLHLFDESLHRSSQSFLSCVSVVLTHGYSKHESLVRAQLVLLRRLKKFLHEVVLVLRIVIHPVTNHDYSAVRVVVGEALSQVSQINFEEDLAVVKVGSNDCSLKQRVASEGQDVSVFAMQVSGIQRDQFSVSESHPLTPQKTSVLVVFSYLCEVEAF